MKITAHIRYWWHNRRVKHHFARLNTCYGIERYAILNALVVAADKRAAARKDIAREASA